MSKRDYYEVLGVGKSAGDDEIKKAYRKMAMQYHPDRNPDDSDAEGKFKEVGEAYSVLSDPDKRARYDRFGHEGMRQPDFGGFGFGGEGFDPFDLFRSVFGGFGGDIFGRGSQGARRKVNRGNDLSVELSLTLEEISEGTTKKVNINYLDRCEECDGSGARDGETATCRRCNGSGEVQQVSESLFGRMINIATCPTCQGEGKTVSNPCRKCSGTGVAKAKKTLNLHAPAGVAEGNYQRLRNEGNAGKRGGPAGDIIVAFREKSHDVFTRHGDDVLCELGLNYSQAVLGGSVEVATLAGTVKLTVPPGTEPGKMFRLRGKGIKHLNNVGRGDQIVKVTIHVPRKVNSAERKLLEQLNDSSDNPHLCEKPFLRKVKDFFR